MCQVIIKLEIDQLLHLMASCPKNPEMLDDSNKQHGSKTIHTRAIYTAPLMDEVLCFFIP